MGENVDGDRRRQGGDSPSTDKANGGAVSSGGAATLCVDHLQTEDHIQGILANEGDTVANAKTLVLKRDACSCIHGNESTVDLDIMEPLMYQ